MSAQIRNQGLTLVETLAALALLSMLIASTSSLTSHIARVSADRQREVRGYCALTSAGEIIAFDLDDWTVACEMGERTVPVRELLTITPTEIELRYPKQDRQTSRTIRYRFDEVSGVLTRGDSTNRASTERIVIGELNRFIVASATDQTIGSIPRTIITIRLTSSTGEHQVIVFRLPSVELTDG